jgi:hypothetical protein
MEIAQKFIPLLFSAASLLHERFTQRMVTADQKLVTTWKSIKQFLARNASRLAVYPRVTLSAGENQVPNAVQNRSDSGVLQYMREEMIDLGASRPIQLNFAEAVETCALLVAI